VMRLRTCRLGIWARCRYRCNSFVCLDTMYIHYIHYVDIKILKNTCCFGIFFSLAKISTLDPESAPKFPNRKSHTAFACLALLLHYNKPQPCRRCATQSSGATTKSGRNRSAARNGASSGNTKTTSSAADHKSKQKRLKILKEKAALGNPDEFSFKMMSSRTKDEVKVGERGNQPLRHEVVKLLKTQDAYLGFNYSLYSPQL
jgi:hypothetical protein